MQRVSGQKDPVIVLLRELTTEDGRRKTGRFFAEGEELVKRAFEFGGRVDCLIVNERLGSAERLLERAERASIPAYTASEGLLAKILGAKPTPDCLAIVERRTRPIDEVLSGPAPLVQMVACGENADNLGMLLRSTDAAGVTGVVLSTGTTDAFSRRVVRGSRGAVFTVPICDGQEPVETIQRAKAAGLQVVAASANADVDYTTPDYAKPTLIIVGNEHVGVSAGVRQAADVTVRIPMLGRINSLNIAVAASILLYEARRQRR